MATIGTLIAQYFIEGLRWQFAPCIYLLIVMYIIHRVNKNSEQPQSFAFNLHIVAAALPIIIPELFFAHSHENHCRPKFFIG